MPHMDELKKTVELDLLLEFEQVQETLSFLHKEWAPTLHQAELYSMFPGLIAQTKKLRDFKQFPIEELVNTLKIASNMITMPTKEHAVACAEQGEKIAPYIRDYNKSFTVSIANFFHWRSQELGLDQIMQNLSKAAVDNIQSTTPK